MQRGGLNQCSVGLRFVSQRMTISSYLPKLKGWTLKPMRGAGHFEKAYRISNRPLTSSQLFRNVPLKSLQVLQVTSHPIAVETMNILATNRAKVYHFLHLQLVHKWSAFTVHSCYILFQFMFVTALYNLMVLLSSGNAFLSENDPPEK